MSSFPPPPPPPPPPVAPAPAVSPKKSGFPVWGWIVIIVAVLGGGAVALFALDGDDDKKTVSATTIVLTDDTSVGTEPPITNAPDTVPPLSDGDGTRDNPIPTGQIVEIGSGWRLQVLEVLPDAGEMMAASDEFFDPAPEGNVYLLVKMALGYFGLEDPKVAFEPDISVVGSSNVALDNFCFANVPDEISFFDYVFTGGVLVGYSCFVAPVAEAGTFQLFAKGDFFSDDGIYFALDPLATPVEPMATLPGPQPGAASTPERLNAAPIGTPTAVGGDWQLTVTGAARDITDAVLAENTFNDPPPTGFRFVGIDVTFTYNGSGTAAPVQVTVGAVGSDNVQHSGYCGVVPGEVDRYTDLFAGGSVSGTLCLVVPDSADPTLAFFASADFNEFVWFATS